MQLFWHLQLCDLQNRKLLALQPQKLEDVKPEFMTEIAHILQAQGIFATRDCC